MFKRLHTNRVIFHHSLSDHATIEEITQWHKARGFDTIGYHFVIQKNGSVDAGRNIHQYGAHAKGKNTDSIGVCFVGDFSKYPPTKEQLQKGAELYIELCSMYGKFLKLEYHHELCPGVMFPRVVFETECGYVI